MINKLISGLSPRVFAIILFFLNVVAGIMVQGKGMINKLLTSDAQGYYQFLPGLFLDKDIEHLPWAIQLDNGNTLSLFHIGVAILEAPFFFIGHLIANIVGVEANGYGEIHSWAILVGTIFYVCVGLFYLQKFLEKKWSRKPAVLTLTLIFFGTNLFYYTTFASGYSHAYTFFLFCLFIFFTDKYHDSPSYKNALIIGVLSGLILIIKPNNLIISLLFIFYGLKNFSEIQNRLLFFMQQWKHVLVILVMIGVVAFPQLLYWHEVSGEWLMFSYGKNDQKFYWNDPQMLKVLGHPQNGWFLYSPMMLFAMFSLIKGSIQKRMNHLIILCIWAISWYVFASWWCWWFGGAFGHRAFTEYLALLAIPMICFLSDVSQLKKAGKIAIGTFIVLFLYSSIHMTIIYQWPWDGPTWGWKDYWVIVQRIFFAK